MKTLGQLTKKYRSQLKSVAKIREQIDVLNKQHQEYQHQIDCLNKEITFTRALVDYCVLTGESPAEAVLKNTRDQIQMKIYELTNFNVAYTTPSWGNVSSLPVVPATLSITNTGNLSTLITSGVNMTDPNLGQARVNGSSGGLIPGV